jgi:nitrosocyanin
MNLPRSRQAVAALAVGALAFTAAGCSHDTDHRTINVAAVNGKPGFTPEVTKVKRGDKVVLAVHNTSDKTHGFDIEGYGVKPKTVDAGQTIQVKFTAKKTGTYKIYCQLHPAHQFATFEVD